MFWWFCMRFSVFNAILFLLMLLCLFVCLFFLRFCGGGWFFLRFLIDPLTDSSFANWKSLFLKLQIFLFVLFRVLNKSRPCLVISSEIVRGILLIFNFFYFLEIKCSCLFHFTLEFMTEMYRITSINKMMMQRKNRTIN